MTDRVVVVTNEDIKHQKLRLKGKARHDPKETNRYQRMNLQKYDVMLSDGTVFSTQVYNNIKEGKRRSNRSEDGRGKWNRKHS